LRHVDIEDRDVPGVIPLLRCVPNIYCYALGRRGQPEMLFSMEYTDERGGHIPQEATECVVAGGNFLGEPCFCTGYTGSTPAAELKSLTDADLNIGSRIPRAGLR
jgi:hypothetical protein